MTRLMVRLGFILCIVLSAAMLLFKSIGRGPFLAFFSTGQDITSEKRVVVIDRDLSLILTRDALSFGTLSWSPDGRRLAFNAQDCNGVCIYDFSLGKILTPEEIGIELPTSNLSWASDGRFAFLSRTGFNTPPNIVIGDSSGNIQVYSPALDVQNDSLMWSFDGHYVTFTIQNDARRFDLYLLDTVTGDMINVNPNPTDQSTHETYAAWSHQGELMYTAFADDGAYIYAFNPVSGETREVVDYADYDMLQATFLSDSRLAFVTRENDIASVNVLDLNTHEVSNIENYHSAVATLSLAWTTDGEWMAANVLSNTVSIGINPPSTDVSFVHIASGEVYNLTIAGYRLSDPTWSP